MNENRPPDQTSPQEPMKLLHWAVIGLCFLLNMLDGMDVLVMSYAAPLIMDEWSIDPAKFGLVFSSALVGMAVGAALISPLADRYGRRRLVITSAVIIALGMIASAAAVSMSGLMALRMATGLGIGAMLASLTSVAAEFSSPARRNLAIGLVLSGYPIGATVTGFVIAPLLDEYGWRWLFQGAGLISLGTVPLVMILMPESLSFLLDRQPPQALERANRLLRRTGARALERLPPGQPSQAGTPSVRRLLTTERRADTLWLWLAFFMSFLSMYFLLSWVPKLVLNAGLGLENGIYAGALFNLGAFFGIALLGHFSYRFGLRRLITLFFGITVSGMLLFGILNTSVEVMLLETFMLGFFMQGGFVGLYAVAAQVYPVGIRTTGVGWAIGAGRTGAIIGPYLGGHAIAFGWSMSTTFTLFALPCLVAALATAKMKSPNIN